MSIIWEGMKAQPTFSLPSPALCEFRHSGRSLHSQVGGAPAGGAYCKRGHRLFHGLAPHYLLRVPQLPGVYCKTLVIQPAFLVMEPVLCYSSRILRKIELSPEGSSKKGTKPLFSELSRIATAHVRSVGQHDCRPLS